MLIMHGTINVKINNQCSLHTQLATGHCFHLMKTLSTSRKSKAEVHPTAGNEGSDGA
jgi:hypothetical protein